MGPPECSGSPEAERTHVTASGRNGQQFMEDEFSIETLWGGTRMENRQCGTQGDCTMWWGAQSQSPTTAASGSDVSDEDVELGELLSMLDHDNGQQHDETEDAVAIGEVVAMINWQEEDRQLNQRQQTPLIVSPAAAAIVSPTAAAAAVYQELSAPRIPLPAIPVPLPPLPVPLVTPLAGLELPKKTNTLGRDLSLIGGKSTVRSEVSNTCCNVATSAATNRTKKLRRWASVEKECLKQGVALYGEGNWLKIKQHFPHELADRSNVDLKDKWRNLYGNRQSRKRKQKQNHSARVEKGARLVVA